MQQFITSSEACALLDRILRTSQSLNQVIEKYIQPLAVVAPPEPVIQPVIVAEPALLPPAKTVIAPVLTIKLSDLVREGERARQRRLQHQRPRPPAPRTRSTRPSREVEVLYRRGFRMVS